MKQLIIGVDVSLKQLDVATWTEQKAQFLETFENVESDLDRLQQTICQMQSQLKAERVLIVLEPTGGYEQLLVRFALSTNWDVAFVNPHNFRQWVKGVGVRAKTDKQDALMLATYGASIQPPTWQPMPEDVEILDHLLSRGQELSAMLQQEKNRLHALCHKPVKSVMAAQSVEASIAFIEEQLSQVKSAVEDHFDKNLLLKDQKKHLLSVPGVGQKNVLNL